MGLSPYKSIIELYYEKVGLKPVYDTDNAPMFWGRTLEATIAEQWQYWEGSTDSLIENSKIGKVIRKCRRCNAYVQNKSFPWIYVSLDRIINKTNELKEGSLECKTISGYAANMWENGIPPMYVVQLQTQLLVCEFDHGEMAILKDGRDFEVYPFDRHEQIINRVKEQSLAFFNMVKAGIKHFILASYCPDQNIMADHLAKIDYSSPEPDGSLAYELFLKEQYKDYGTELEGQPEHLEDAFNYTYYKKEMDKLELLQRECSNRLKAYMKEANKLKFGELGIVTWKQNAKGSRVFNVKVKCEENYVPEVKTNTQKTLLGLS
jgi:putative phage-type endonuclease